MLAILIVTGYIENTGLSDVRIVNNECFLLFVQETSETTDLQTTLQLSMKAIQHENVDVRIHALTSLKETLYKNQVC